VSRSPPAVHATDRFAVEVEDVGALGVAEVRGLETTVGRREVPLADVLPRWLVGDRTVLRRDTVSPPLVLVRAATTDDTFQTWFERWVAQGTRTRTVRVALLDAAGREQVAWECPDAYPTRWVGPQLRTDRATVATESLELAHEGVTRADG
jgi:phage tail-like protein